MLFTQKNFFEVRITIHSYSLLKKIITNHISNKNKPDPVIYQDSYACQRCVCVLMMIMIFGFEVKHFCDILEQHLYIFIVIIKNNTTVWLSFSFLVLGLLLRKCTCPMSGSSRHLLLGSFMKNNTFYDIIIWHHYMTLLLYDVVNQNAAHDITHVCITYKATKIHINPRRFLGVLQALHIFNCYIGKTHNGLSWKFVRNIYSRAKSKFLMFSKPWT